MNNQEHYLQDIRSLSEVQEHLYEKQIDRLKVEAEANKDAIKEVVNYAFKFSHPTINWKSTLGPVLAHKNDFLYVYTSDDKVVKFDLQNDHREYPSSFEEVVKADGFEEAIQGFKAIESIYQAHSDSLRLSIRELEMQLKEYE